MLCFQVEGIELYFGMGSVFMVDIVSPTKRDVDISVLHPVFRKSLEKLLGDLQDAEFHSSFLRHIEHLFGKLIYTLRVEGG